MSDESNNQPRFCTNCGTQTRPEIHFCVSCGASLLPTQESREANFNSSGPSISEQLRSYIESLGKHFSTLKARLPTSSANVTSSTRQGTPNSLLGWFRDLPSIPKMIIIGVLTVILLFVMISRIRDIATLLFGMSILALIVRRFQRRSLREWGIIAALSLSLVIVSGGLSEIVYAPDSQRETVAGGLNPDPIVEGEAPAPENVELEALSQEERDYLRRSASVRSRSDELLTDQLERFNNCQGLDSCLWYDLDMAINNEEMADLYRNAAQAAMPSDYEESHEALVAELDVSNELILLLMSGEVSQSTYDVMYSELTDHRIDSIGAIPKNGEEFYADQWSDN